MIDSATLPEQIGPEAALVEESGFSEVLVAEDYFYGGGIASAMAALAATRRIPVYLGIVSAFARHPAVSAMEFASVARMFPGRFRPGISLGFPPWVRQLGHDPTGAVTTVREYTSSIRELLSGVELTTTARNFTVNAARLTHPPTANVPLYLGVTGPKLLQVSGQHGDGTIMNYTATPGYVAWARRRVIAAAQQANHARSHTFPVGALFCVDHDRARARTFMRNALAEALTDLGKTAITDHYGISDALASMVARGGAPAVAEQMPEQWITDMSVCGTPSECAEKLRALHEAGADSVLLCPRGPYSTPQITAAEVLPLLRS